MAMRVLKDLEFEHWAAKNNVTDDMLCKAAREIEAGLIDARLGGYLIKKRIAAPGRSKSRSYRTIVGHRQSDRLIFVHGFAKNEQDNISKAEKKALQKLCSVYMQLDDRQLSDMAGRKLVLEMTCNEQDTEERP